MDIRLVIGLISIVALQFAAIIHLYIWTFKMSQSISDKFVSINICKVLHIALREDIKEIKSDIKCILRKLIA